MLFNSVEYLIFLPLVVALYYTIAVKWRWLLLLIASYFFYMCWKPEYVILIMVTTGIDYWASIRMDEQTSVSKRKPWLLLSVVANLGMLTGFKYLNFISTSANWIFSEMNATYSWPIYNILLPVGISFYIFQSMSYAIDVYRGNRKPEKHLGKYALYVSFFPQLVAGPIERSTSLLPQIHNPRSFNQDNLLSGLKLILWGFFKKVVIADRLGMFVTYVFDNPSQYAGISVILAAVLFAFQLYCDFSGYTDIARGSARLLGYNLMINFNRPLIAKSLSDFWNRWHISLTTWFRDYLLYSLPYIKNKKLKTGWLYRNIIITFLLMGLWHGAAWTFILFGAFHGIMLVLENITANSRERLFNNNLKITNTLGIVYTFSMVTLSLFLFRANSLNDSLVLLTNALDFSHTKATLFDLLKNLEVVFGIIMVIGLLIAEHLHEKYNLEKMIASRPVIIRWGIYSGFIFFVLLFGVLQEQKFIYFQF